ncbi:MAG TPA: tRNA (N(6)-L-threonylcarbamoyladenosine(37)-C(2))-methylthiotransferase MtaB [Candidatus Hydrogenedentes bacterium]|jgi:threonylcarbamoyladenosine tRNA methylthiotransferase MtaB|nr:MAG: Threonylcarbamoyladenosine tRNA methylthiotransferase MtaB [Candidatus Hydrogenedentes bacterium ADurb.Bin170]HNZ49257.1 tRNA (N(6)-L-threonylcarbamoyladenosine(37)-C(2))-methylthiotransferase MtaB [Candidatus Hydrogenedentota bacterium]HOD96366.1 tRNA (N(6)-L-threonylcarbamoyladenosine(37)-C(2))-methylthiotransferase MtaB [Candidatus Hydrogenedentota bacterium]HOR51793.1 tRNA (N(6)-L-threonylcarbamoyladenosine(37)-C(2))-methylthiotransferase MtaB [Candidatus Hydrogenedentota bacterium]
MQPPADNAEKVNEARTASIHTLGCRLNQAETRLLEEQLREAGYRIVPFDQPADVGIVHGCVVTVEAEAKTRKYIQRFRRKNPGSITVAIGCFAQTAADSAAVLGVDLVLGNASKMELLHHLEAMEDSKGAVVTPRPKRDAFMLPFQKSSDPVDRRINLKIQDGCDEMCSYCFIPFARGRSRSRYLSDVLDEAASLVERGARELILSGVNVGDYREGGADLLTLIDRLNGLRPRPRIRISSIELNTIPEGVLERMADTDHGLLPYLHIPLQSGSDPILKAMGRPYTADAYLRFLEKARNEVPMIGLGADVMVGFPGETEALFEETRRLIDASPLDYLHVFPYSERDAVASSRLSHKISDQDKRRRSEIVRALGDQKQEQGQLRFLHRRCRVLFEEKRGAYWIGSNEEYFEAAVQSEECLKNRVASVDIREVREERLFGTLAV